jgi:hypothetical protein
MDPLRCVLCAVSVLAAAGLSHAFAAPAGGGAAVGEIVVTAEKALSDYDPQRTPSVVLVRRADNLITEVKVVCDTRDPTLRRAELKDTLRAMILSAGRSGKITLGVGDEVVGAFDETMLDKVIAPDNKIDTSVARVVIKTPVAAGDTFDSASGRILTFIGATPKSGRTEILREQDWNLTIIGPERNRPALLDLIAQDARVTAAVFGAGYGVSVDGLQHPIAWYQQGPLDLALYITYRLEVSPLPRP